MSEDTKECPNCHANLQGAPIPEQSREHYGNATHFSRLIGIVDPMRDRVTDWQCPDCGFTWARILTRWTRGTH